MRISAAKALSAAVHHIRELVKGSPHFLRKARCHFVGRRDHERVQTLLHSQRLTGIDPDTGASELDTENSGLRELYHIVHRKLLIGQKSGQKLRDARRIEMLVNILGVEHSSGIRFHQNSALRADRRTLGPSLDAVALDLLTLALFRFRVVIDFLVCLFRCPYRNRADREDQKAAEYNCEESCSESFHTILSFPVYICRWDFPWQKISPRIPS